MNPTIVVVAYNRPRALHRLLASIKKAHHPPAVRLVISIDPGADNHAAVREIAAQFAWTPGEKQVIVHKKHLGLIEHVFFCGGLSQEYGAIILLEDDLYVSQKYYTYAMQTLDFYGEDSRIAGISLNALWFNGYTHQPFMPLLDDADVFFLQVPWYQGQAYTRAQWAAFSGWYTATPRTVTAADALHEMFLQFPATDWFPLMTKYLVDTGRYYVFPRESLTTNFGDVGTHFAQPTNFFQVPLQQFKQRFRLQAFGEAAAVYDSFMELLPERLNRLTDVFAGYDYDVDLYGTKSPAKLNAEYVLTTKRCRSPLFTFGKAMWPLEANVIEGVPGVEIVFGKKDDLDTGWFATLATQKSNHDYFATHRRRPGRWLRLQFWLLRILHKLGRQ